MGDEEPKPMSVKERLALMKAKEAENKSALAAATPTPIKSEKKVSSSVSALASRISSNNPTNIQSIQNNIFPPTPPNEGNCSNTL